jgi:hypothetical protein
MIWSRLPRIFLTPHGSNRKKLRYASPYHVHLNRMGSNGHPGPYLFASTASGPQNLLHHDTVLGCGLAASSIATACPHDDNNYANARTERKTRNREHLRAFSFHFCTSKCCNPTRPFAYYKRGGRDPRPKTAARQDNTTQWQCTKHTLKHLNTPTHTNLGAIPLSTNLYPPTTSTLVQSNTSSSEHWR